MAAALLLAGCGTARSKFELTVPSGPPNELRMPIPSGLTGQERARVLAGGAVAGQAGCLACHRIGDQGNDGPGPNLTRVGSRLSGAALVQVLRAPRPPMPSFATLPRAKLAELVEFLHALR